MLQSIVSGIVGVGIAAAGILGLNGHNASTTPRPDFTNMASTTRTFGERGGGLSSGAFSSTTVACVGAAVAAREQTLGTAENSFTASVNAAYVARASALAAAYAATSLADVRTGIRTAWSAFSSSTRAARQTWNTAQRTAWQTFMSAARACNAPASISDASFRVLDNSGQ